MKRAFIALVVCLFVIVVIACKGATAEQESPQAVTNEPYEAVDYSYSSQVVADEFLINFPVPDALSSCGLSQEELKERVRSYANGNAAELRSKDISAIDVINCPDAGSIGALLLKTPGNVYVPPEHCQELIRNTMGTRDKSIPAPDLPEECYPPAHFEPVAIPK